MKWAATLSIAIAILNAVAASPTFLLDTTFPNGTGPDNAVWALAVQPDGRLLIAGNFTNVNGIARARLARLLPDGSLDPSFSNGIGGPISRVSALADGRILVSGAFTNVGDVYAPGIARLFPDGSHDPSFNAPAPARNASYYTALPAGGGRVWITGSFTNVGPVWANRLARLLEDGSPDPTFISPLRTSDIAPLIAPLPDSRLLVAGQPTALGTPSLGLVRLKADGAIDPTFQPPIPAGTFVSRLMLSKDGRILVNVPSFSPRSLLRLMDDGAIDDSFHAEFSFSYLVITPGAVLPLLVQSDAKVMVTGPFFSINGIPRPGLARLNSDGSTDLCFDVGLGTDTALAAVEAPDRSIVIAGYFHDVEGVGRNFIARLRPQSECAPGMLDFSTPVTRTTEDTQRVTMSIVRTGGVVGEVSVDFATADGSAMQGKDYQAVSGTVRFAPGERVQSISIPLLNDPSVTGERSFDIRLGNPGGGAALGVLGKATVVIADVPLGQVAGRVDTNFVVRLDGPVRSLLRSPDGRFLVAMGRTNFSVTAVKGLRRLLADGSPDTQFVATNEFDADVAGVLQLPDARILAWGEFSSINGVPRRALARFSSEGVLDEAFDPFTNNPLTPSQVAATSVGLRPDGSVICGGKLFVSSPEPLWRTWFRITPDGALDMDLVHRSVAIGSVSRILLLSDGAFVAAGEVLNRSAVRVGNDGTVDPRFVMQAREGPSVAMAVMDPSGMLVLGGSPRYPYEPGSPILVRVTPGGTRDPGFAARILRDAGRGIPEVTGLAPGPDGKIVIAGEFESVENIRRRGLARLFQDGAVDLSFDPGAGLIARVERSGSYTNEFPLDVRVILPLPEGGWLVGGDFAGCDQFLQPHLVKLLPESPASSSEINLNVAALSIVESNRVAQIEVLRTGDATGVAVVDVSAVALTASPGVDFEFSSGTNRIEFAPGDRRKTLLVPIASDNSAELDEQFAIRIHNAVGTILAAPTNTLVTILDDDVNVGFTADEFHGSENDGSGEITLFRSGVASGVVRVDVRVGTEVIPIQFAAAPTRQTSTLKLRVPVIDDAIQNPGRVLDCSIEITSGNATPAAHVASRLLIDDNDTVGGPVGGVAGIVETLALTPDDRLYVAGEFSGIHGVPRRNVARLLPDGEVEVTFDPGAGPNGAITQLAIQPDGKLLVLGRFDFVSGAPRNHLARLNTDGSLDSSFDTGLGAAAPTGMEPLILAVAVQGDGNILVGGLFSQFGGEPRKLLVRLLPSGEVDRGFVPTVFQNAILSLTTGGISFVSQLDALPDGRILALGTFSYSTGLPRYGPTVHLQRVLPDGRNDPAFQPLTNVVGAGSRLVNFTQWGTTTMARLASDELLVGMLRSAKPVTGRPPTTLTNWVPILRLDTNGRVNTNWTVRGLPAEIKPSAARLRTLLPVADGSVLFAVHLAFSSSNSLNATQVSMLGRLSDDGNWDNSFQSAIAPSGALAPVPHEPGRFAFNDPYNRPYPRASFPTAIRAIARHSDGTLVVGGDFDSIDGLPRRRLARVDPTGGLRGQFRLVAAYDLAQSQVRLYMPGDLERPYVIELSNDLKTWQPVSTNATPRRGVVESISRSLQREQQFFRARALE